MIKLIRKADDSKADHIESRFKNLILSYKTETAACKHLPKIIDGDSVITGDEEIEAWLRELEDELSWQRSLSGDGCYIDPDSGDVC